MVVFIIVLVAIGISVLYIISNKFSSSKGSSCNSKSGLYLGKQGEDIVKEVLSGNIEGKRYVINDITIKDKFGNTAQIDHIVINKSGIHVIETKNWSGIVEGKIEDKNWVESFVKSDREYSLYNPIMQNETHIKRLRSSIGSYVPFYNIVCFTNDKVMIKTNNYQNICYVGNLKREIEKEGNITSKDIQNTYEKIRKLAV